MLSIFSQNILKLKLIPFVGNKTIFNIINKFPEIRKQPIDLRSITSLFSSKQISEFKKIENKLDEKLEKLLLNLEKHNVQVINLFDKNFPESLQNIFDQPIILFVKGQLHYDYNLSIAVVGTRKFTRYGQEFCIKFCEEFAKNNFTIISGLASGIDTIAHTTALKNNGKCIGVLGGGFDYIYPSSNFRLYEKIIENNGCLITEYFPDQMPDKRFFPARNRIIAGLAKSTFVIEAAAKSGSLITANLAFEQGKDVYAIPADLNRINSQGCNDLIKRNIAKLVSEPKDILEDYGFNTKNVSLQDRKNGMSLDGNKRLIYELICKEPYTIDDLINLLDIDMTEIAFILSELEIEGFITKNEDESWSPLGK